MTSWSTFVLIQHFPYTEHPTYNVWECHHPLTSTDTGPLVDIGSVFTLQPFTCVTGVHFRTDLPFLTGTHQAADAVIQDQGHPGETHGGFLRALASPRTHLGPGKCKHLGGKENEPLAYMLLSLFLSKERINQYDSFLTTGIKYYIKK